MYTRCSLDPGASKPRASNQQSKVSPRENAFRALPPEACSSAPLSCKGEACLRVPPCVSSSDWADRFFFLQPPPKTPSAKQTPTQTTTTDAFNAEQTTTVFPKTCPGSPRTCKQTSGSKRAIKKTWSVFPFAQRSVDRPGNEKTGSHQR
jgi:hypothetical protein